MRRCTIAALLCFAGCAPAPPIIEAFSCALSPNAPLTALCSLRTDRPVDYAIRFVSDVHEVTVGPSGNFDVTFDIPVLGLRPGQTYDVEVRVQDPDGTNGYPQHVSVRTEPLPDEVPPLDLLVSRPRKMEPGVTLLPFVRWPIGAGPEQTFGLILGVDPHANVVWYYRADHTITAVHRIRNGNLLYHSGMKGRVVEIDMLGNVVRRWHARALSDTAPPDSIQVGVDTLHHDVQELPSGNLLAIATEVREFPDYPSSETDPDAPKKDARVVGDMIVEFTRDGDIVRQHSLFDLLDPYRIGYDSLDTGFWRDVYATEPYPFDWSHANSVFYDAGQDSVIVSVYHQDAVFKFDMETGEIQWILGIPSGWREPWTGHLLRPLGIGMMPCHEHAAKITPRGTILMYDNGTYRATPFEPKRPAHQNFSRAVEYEVNERAGTLAQLWSYGGPEDEVFFSPILGDTDWLPETGNVLITDGARITAPNGAVAGHPRQGREWARVIEVTRESPAEKVWEIVIDDLNYGWTVYRAERLSNLEPN